MILPFPLNLRAMFASFGLILVTLGCSHSRDPNPLVRANAGPCYISVTKMSEGNLVFTIMNVKGRELLIQRHGNWWGNLTFDVKNVLGRWEELSPVNSNSAYDYPSPTDHDWVSLRSRDSASWYLNYNAVGRLKVGDMVRMHWHVEGKVPKTLQDSGTVFPSVPLEIILRVR